MTFGTVNSGNQDEARDQPTALPDGTIQFTNENQIRNYLGSVVKKAFVKTKHGLTDQEVQILSQPLYERTSHNSVPLSQESDVNKLRKLLPEGTLMASSFESLLELMPNPNDKTDRLEFMEKFHPNVDERREKTLLRQIKNTIASINAKFREHKIAPYFRLSRGIITRLR